MDYITARNLLLARMTPIETEDIPLETAAGRILAEDLAAREAIPWFDRSAYDGYAFRAADVRYAAAERPVTLSVIEEVPAGRVPKKAVTDGTAVKILTGAPIPQGADAVIAYERTTFTDTTVTLTTPVPAGSNIVRAGEDVRIGTPIAAKGTRIDAGLAGALAAQGLVSVCVYRRPTVGILSTGSEIIDPAAPHTAGKTRDTNYHTLAAALFQNGFLPKNFGIVTDDAAAIQTAIETALEHCDALLLTGGVSAGDYDVTPIAMEAAGTELLFHGVSLKPGMACAYGFRKGKLLAALSGNPASAYTSFFAIALPALKQLAGDASPIPETFPVTLASEFKKRSPATRLLRGTVDLTSGTAVFRFAPKQGNAVLLSAVGCNAFAIIPAGSGPVPAGTQLSAFWA